MLGCNAANVAVMAGDVIEPLPPCSDSVSASADFKAFAAKGAVFGPPPGRPDTRAFMIVCLGMSIDLVFLRWETRDFGRRGFGTGTVGWCAMYEFLRDSVMGVMLPLRPLSFARSESGFVKLRSACAWTLASMGSKFWAYWRRRASPMDDFAEEVSMPSGRAKSDLSKPGVGGEGLVDSEVVGEDRVEWIWSCVVAEAAMVENSQNARGME